jgi:hypothetical protein
LEQWQLFEDEVAGLYRMLGFKVTKGVVIPGQQIDLVCEQWIPGIGPTRLCVECKYVSPSRPRQASISNQLVHDFIAMFKSKRESQRWSAGVIVSNATFTEPAKAAANDCPDVYVKVLDDLYEELLKVRAYLHKMVHTIETTGDISDYIPLNARNLDQDLNRTGHTATLQSIYDKWLSDASPQLCLLADFGSGKTTFLLHVFHCLATRYLDGERTLIPLFIPLRDYYDSPTADHLIEKFFSRECGALIDVRAFHGLLARGKFILLLDGYDEMGASTLVSDRKAHYLKLAALVARGRKAIVTCRPAYFPKKQELKAVFVEYRSRFGISFRGRTSTHPSERHANASGTALDPEDTEKRLSDLFATTSTVYSRSEFVEIQPFDERQVTRYLRQYDETITRLSNGRLNGDSLRILIADTYDLEDLARRPILLKLIVLTLPKAPVSDNRYIVTVNGEERSFNEVTPALLYWLYIEDELRREEEERGPVARIVSRAGKLRILREIAAFMHEVDAVTIDDSDYHKVVRAASNELADADAVAAEVRSCSFLSRDHRDCVRFTHKSFMEYFTALSLCEKIKTPGLVKKLLGQKVLSQEIAFFFGDLVSSLFAARTATLRTAISPVDTVQGRTVTENCLNVLNFSRQPQPFVEGVTVGAIYYDRLSSLNLALRDSRIEVMKFRRSSGSCRIDQSRISQLGFDNCNIGSLVITGSTIGYWRSVESRVKLLSIRDGEFTFDRGSEFLCDRIEARNAVFMERRASPEPVSRSYRFTGQVSAYEDCVFYRVDLSSMAEMQALSFRGCVFILCKAEVTLGQLNTQSCRGVIISGLGEQAAFGNNVKWLSPRELESVATTREPPNWHSALIESFARPSPRSGTEVRQRLAATNTFYHLRGHIGKRVDLRAGEARQAKLVACDLDTIRIVPDKKAHKATELLAQISETSIPPRLPADCLSKVALGEWCAWREDERREAVIPTHAVEVKINEHGRMQLNATGEAQRILEPLMIVD